MFITLSTVHGKFPLLNFKLNHFLFGKNTLFIYPWSVQTTLYNFLWLLLFSLVFKIFFFILITTACFKKHVLLPFFNNFFFLQKSFQTFFTQC